MPIRAIMPVLKVHDFEGTLRFYEDILGFTSAWRTRDEGGETALLEWGDASVMLSTGQHLGAGKPAFTGTLYFEMTGVPELWERLQSKTTVVWPLSQMDYGTMEFGIRDPEGYTLAFSEDRA